MWLQSFLFTLAVEVPLFMLVAYKKVPAWKAALAGAAGTCFTHPCLWFIWPALFHSYKAYVISGEILVATIESFTFFAIARPIPLSRAIAASFIANACSFGLGALLHYLGIMT